MSLRLEMLQVARLAPAVLGAEASRLIEDFVRGQQLDDGGFSDRERKSDLYYTCFAIDALTALQAELPIERLTAYLERCSEQVESLDFVHLCCLARALSALPELPEQGAATRERVYARLESEFRADDGGYTQESTEEEDEDEDGEGSRTGSAYACFLAYGAYSDHGRELPDAEGVRRCLASLAMPVGGWSNDLLIPVCNVPATAAAITLLRNLRSPVPPETSGWLLSCIQSQSGGFLPFPNAPLPDLLSTAVALHALDGIQADFSAHKEGCLDFIDSLWTAEGGFHGTWDDDELDLEYTYYGLLALGHLSL